MCWRKPPRSGWNGIAPGNGSGRYGAADTYNDIEMAWLMKLRTVVARLGEMDCGRWWNSDGQLGAQGASVLRGASAKHQFAQARSVNNDIAAAARSDPTLTL